ncbi:DUF1073 domain-containing protein [Serratia sp. 14-2641]|uniref:phage portal protein n=1 Tax=Serratia sp. 14-2641 TaxID=1841657 RepID=UPI00080F83FA|nr:DUF1073 domain-containing protein [Serratia sp. 14-2641]OCJ20010.1 phage head protein [Serratia sp. 14-2641]
MGWFKRKKKANDAPAPKERESFFSTHNVPVDGTAVSLALSKKVQQIKDSLPKVVATGTNDSMDDGGNLASPHVSAGGTISDSLFMWYANNGFIGHAMNAIIAQHWLVLKACSMPGRDAIRNGYTVQSESDEELPAEAIKMISRYDKKFGVNDQMKKFITFGRVFGIRIALFKVTSTDPDYYENPFNPDGVTPGSYKGIAQIDPMWCTPEVDGAAVINPASLHFYEPTYWVINGKRYHRSHLVIYIPYPVATILKAMYQFGGMSLPQLIMERIYAAERTANEAPSLALSKRTTIYKTDMAKAMANEDEFTANLSRWVRYRDNYGVKLADKEEDEITQMDTALADFDNLIMTQYQLVAAIAEVPSTRLMGTQPKGFNSNGDYEETTYHETLESIQTHDLTPLLDRHHLLLMRSHIAPKLGIDPVETSVNWESLESMTATERATVRETDSRTDLNLVNTGAIDQYDVRDRLIADPDSGYSNLAPAVPPDDDDSGELNNGEETAGNGAEATAET